MDAFVEILTKFGLPTALVIFFLWSNQNRTKQDRDDRKEMVAQIKDLDTYQKTTFQETLMGNTLAMTKISDSNETLITSTDKLHRALEKRVDV